MIKIFKVLLFFSLCLNLYSQWGSQGVALKDEDGTPLVWGVWEIAVPNTSLTDNGSGKVSLDYAAGIGAALTAGSVVFSDGTTLTEDNANFFWDDVNNRLGIGTTSPAYDIQIITNNDGSPAYSLVNSSTNGGHAFVTLHTRESGGDPQVGFGIDDDITGASIGNSWHMGTDNSADDDFKIAQGSIGAAGADKFIISRSDGTTRAVYDFRVGNTNNLDYKLLATQPGVTPETPILSSALLPKAIGIQGDGGAYFSGRDITNDIEFIMGTSNVGLAFLGSMSNHDLDFRTGNNQDWFLDYSDSGSLKGRTDSEKLTLGASEDLKLYHDGSSNVIDTGGTDLVFYNSGAGNVTTRFVENGVLQLSQGINSSGSYVIYEDSASNITALIRGYASGNVQGYFTAGYMGFGDATPVADVDVGGGVATYIDGSNDLIVLDDIEIDDDLYVQGTLQVDTTTGTIIPSSSTYAFTRLGDADTGVWFDVSNPRYEFHRDGTALAYISAETTNAWAFRALNTATGTSMQVPNEGYVFTFTSDTDTGLFFTQSGGGAEWRLNGSATLTVDVANGDFTATNDLTSDRDTIVSRTLRTEGVTTADVTKTANYTAAITDHAIFCDATSGAITITLPSASPAQGREYHIKKIDSSTNTVTIDGNGSQTIDGALTQVIIFQYDSVMIKADGSNWFIL